MGVMAYRLSLNGCHFADDIFRCNFVNERFCILITISLEFVPKGPINNTQSQYSIIGLAPARRKAIIWNDVDAIHYRMHAVLGGEELNS